MKIFELYLCTMVLQLYKNPVHMSSSWIKVRISEVL